MTPRSAPMDELSRAIRSSNIIRFSPARRSNLPDIHLKELAVTRSVPTGNGRRRAPAHQFWIRQLSRLDHDPRVIAALARRETMGHAVWGLARVRQLRVKSSWNKKIARWMELKRRLFFLRSRWPM